MKHAKLEENPCIGLFGTPPLQQKLASLQKLHIHWDFARENQSINAPQTDFFLKKHQTF